MSPTSDLAPSAEPAAGARGIRLPDPATLFLNCSHRFEMLADGHPLSTYLEFVGTVCRAQHEVQASLPPVALEPRALVLDALRLGYPPLSPTEPLAEETAVATVRKLMNRLAGIDGAPETAAVVHGLLAASPAQRARALAAAGGASREIDLARRTLLFAGLEVHFARLAALLEPMMLRFGREGGCPACGSPPVCLTVARHGEREPRICTCSLCGTGWTAADGACALCGKADGLTRLQLEAGGTHGEAETCRHCRRYLKVLSLQHDPALQPIADDVATLAVDLEMGKLGWQRGGQNTFLLAT